MSKVISFSLTNKQLEVLQALYPNESVNLSAKDAILSVLDSNIAISSKAALELTEEDRLKRFERKIEQRWARYCANLETKIGQLEQYYIALSSNLSHVEYLSDRLFALTERVSKLERVTFVQDQQPEKPKPPARQGFTTVTVVRDTQSENPITITRNVETGGDGNPHTTRTQNVFKSPENPTTQWIEGRTHLPSQHSENHIPVTGNVEMVGDRTVTEKALQQSETLFTQGIGTVTGVGDKGLQG